MAKTTLDEILNTYVLYFAGTPQAYSALTTQSPFGKELVFIDVFDSMNAPFFDLLNQLDGLSYGDKSLAMPKWVGLDCALLPSGFVGVGLSADTCPQDLAQKFSPLTAYKGVVPLSEYCAIPTMQEGHWIGHTLASLVQGGGVGFFTKLLGFTVFPITHYTGVAQYTNPSLKVHTKFSPLKLKTVMTPAHSEPLMTFVYEHVVDRAVLPQLFSQPVQQESLPYQQQHVLLLLDPHNFEAKQSIQEQMKLGYEFMILPPGHVEEGGKLCIPMTMPW